MKISPTKIPGVMEVEVTPLTDERGLFARTFCAETFAGHGLADRYPHQNTSYNPRRGTLRGLHLQAEPSPEAKLVRATRGRVFDVAVDLRPASPAYRDWTAVELDANRRNALYIPAGCAHGFLTLEDDSEVFYLMSETYVPALARTYRWNDPAFGVDWPFEPSVISARDAAAEDYTP
ncbi:dTDP-4-dehydrorhamnose 3,5-epimerase [Azorhizobium sp. AG788]|uniref:dTDP-4-dehydrorhamnose 3,5-epimerase n=1 Tax=Azorhizobium sp. AG788 TaxID=2183897 RepID=UPI00105D5EDF|nr:dTDP-4-dehydrorhamnose 3,5-epimerase [Azorhizobium sp. AG788]TDU01195.1 dTDP-4-dehydrorhamnose 3,5-epimerase [Azorhizobium sp. AG788]